MPWAYDAARYQFVRTEGGEVVEIVSRALVDNIRRSGWGGARFGKWAGYLEGRAALVDGGQA